MPTNLAAASGEGRHTWKIPGDPAKGKHMPSALLPVQDCTNCSTSTLVALHPNALPTTTTDSKNRSRSASSILTSMLQGSLTSDSSGVPVGVRESAEPDGLRSCSEARGDAKT